MQDQVSSSAAVVDRRIGQTLQWALVVATYRRAAVLAQCVECALRQTRPPAEIIIVDASDDWEASKATIANLVGNIRLIYEKAKEASLTRQRNQGINLATADILFLIDDDSLMHVDAADEVMRIYEADVDRAVAGIRMARGTRLEVSGHDTVGAAEEMTKGRSRSVEAVRRFLNTERIHIPYDPRRAVGMVPESLKPFDVGVMTEMSGFAMTARREMALSEPFAAILLVYAAFEDVDFSYRLGRHGLLLLARGALIHHIGASSGRLPVGVVTALGALNAMVLHRIHGMDRNWSRRQLRRLWRRRLIVEFLKDIHRGDKGLPRGRGIAFALRHLDAIFARTPDELEAWYPQFQRQLIERKK